MYLKHCRNVKKSQLKNSKSENYHQRMGFDEENSYYSMKH